MAKLENIIVRVTKERKEELARRAKEAGYFTLTDYIRQVLFVNDAGVDLREAIQKSIKA